MTEKNRNLSDVIHSITDEGPSPEAPADGPPDVVASPAPAAVPQRSMLWIAAACLLAGMLLAGIFLLAAGGGESSSPTSVSSAVPAESRQAIDPQLQVLHQRQDLLDSQLKQLAAVVAESNAILLKLLDQQFARNTGRTALPAAPAAVDNLQAETISSPQEDQAEAPVAVMESVVEPVAMSENVVEPVAIVEQAPVDASVVQLEPVFAVQTSGAEAAQGWVINVAFFESQEPVDALMQRFSQAGITTGKQKVTVNGVDGYRLRVTGFSSQAEASDFMKSEIDESLGIEGAWVSTYE